MSGFIHLLYEFTATIGFPSYALAIIFLGIIVRVLLLPLTIIQMKSMLGMQEIQPELQELQKRYATNREKLSEEMMKLYQEYNVKPAAGCLPILIQMPILYVLFYALRAYNFNEHASFFWIDSLNNNDPLFILPIVLALVMFLHHACYDGLHGIELPKWVVYLLDYYICIHDFSTNVHESIA